MKRRAIKTYGRSTESAASRAFDEIFRDKSNKRLSVKAAPTVHKWGKTSFTAVRGRRERELEAKRARLEEEMHDPFSFETEDDKRGYGRRSSPKKLPTTLHPVGSQNLIATTPAVGITTKNTHPNYKQKAKSVPEAFVRTDALYKSPRSYSSKADNTRQLSIDGFTNRKLPSERGKGLDSLSDKAPLKFDHSYSQNFDSQTSSGALQHSNAPVSSLKPCSQSVVEKAPSALSSLSDEDSDDDDGYKFCRKPVKSYSSHKLPLKPSNQSTPERNMKKSPPTTPLQHSPKLRDTPDSFTNSTVISRSEVKNKRGTTIIFLCKPKGMEDTKSVSKKIHKDSASELFDRIIRNKKPPSISSDEEPPNICSPESARDGDSEFSNEEPPPLSPKVSSSESQVSGAKDKEEDLTVTVDSVKLFERSVDAKSDSEDSDAGTVVLDSQKSFLDQDTLRTSKDKTAESAVKSDDNSFKLISKEVAFNKGKCNSMTGGDSNVDTCDSFSKNKLRSVKTYGGHVKKDLNTEAKKIFKSKSLRYSICGSEKQKKLLGSPKKSPSKAVYNPRSWQADIDVEVKQKLSLGNQQSQQAAQCKPVPQQQQAASQHQQLAFKTTSNGHSSSMVGGAANLFDNFDDDESSDPKLTRAVIWPRKIGDSAITSLKVSREHKTLYTVVKNVKQAHECQESGETQEFIDDVEYLLAGLNDTEPLSTRCLSCFSLATKCEMPAFRMHLRAHGTVAKIFKALHDACSDPSLALSTATLMFMLSRDRLNMDLDQDSLSLMLQLLGMDKLDFSMLSRGVAKEYERMKHRVRTMCENLQKEGTAKQVDLNCISTGNLAMESLLSLTSRNAGDSFKEELRSLGALDHIVDTVCDCVDDVGDFCGELTEDMRSKIEKIDRCLRVLENVTFTNIGNQSFLISYKQAALIKSLSSMLLISQTALMVYPLEADAEDGKINKESNGWIVYSCMLAVLRVLLNLTHDNNYGSTKVGSQDGLIHLVLYSLLRVPQNVVINHRFDILVLGLGLLINLVEHCIVNRRLLITMSTVRPFDSKNHMDGSDSQNHSEKVSAVEALVMLFCQKEEAARMLEVQESSSSTESSPNKSGAWHESESGIQWVVIGNEKHNEIQPLAKNGEQKETSTDNEDEPEEDVEETFTKALHRAGKHMEDSIVAAYIALLLGCLIQDNQENVEMVREHLSAGSFEPMIRMLKKFLGFMNLTSAVGNTGSLSIAHVIDTLEAC